MIRKEKHAAFFHRGALNYMSPAPSVVTFFFFFAKITMQVYNVLWCFIPSGHNVVHAALNQPSLCCQVMLCLTQKGKKTQLTGS